jgi:tRNA modification GTPase
VDFEEDLPPLDEEAIAGDIEGIIADIEGIEATADRGELLRSGLKVAIVGRPNVGKSSLLNAWSRCDRAIVTDLPGTTRDVVESQLVVDGIPIQVLDTAGIRHTGDRAEKIGVERSRSAAESADLVLLTVDARQGWTHEDNEIYERVKQRPLILVINKIDLEDKTAIAPPEAVDLVVRTAAAKNQGIEALEAAILEAVRGRNLHAANLDIAINQRQAAALTRAKRSLAQVKATIGDRLPLDFWTIDLRGAIQALGDITGEEVTESVLDRIFSRFCIGK